MNSCSRRSALHTTALLGLSTFAGCASEAPRGSKVYYVYGHVVDEPPEGATVIDASNEQIDDVDAIQRAISESGSENGVTLKVNKTTYESVEAALGRTPVYRDKPKTYANRTGLYVNASGRIIRISVVVSRAG